VLNERVISEAVIRKQSWLNFKVLSQNSPGGTEENHAKPQDTRSVGRDFNQGPPKFKEIVLTSRPRHW
jgi:hypothetical protein